MESYCWKRFMRIIRAPRLLSRHFVALNAMVFLHKDHFRTFKELKNKGEEEGEVCPPTP